MGGFGSGRHYWWRSRATVEGCRSLDVRFLQREGLLQSGMIWPLQWRNSEGEQTASIGVQGLPHRVVLSYRSRQPGEDWQDVEEPVPVTWTLCRYGGSRPWFLCPGNGCGRRVAKLYWGSGSYFLCRHCYGLAYSSQSWGFADRRMEKARRIRMRLGGSASLLEPFPPKPKWMRWGTYWRLRIESEQANLASCMALGVWLDKMERRTKAAR